MSEVKVLVADPISEVGIELLAGHPSISVDVKTGLSAEELLAVVGDYDGLVVRSQTKVSKEVLLAAGRLKIVGRAGVGVDNIDRNAATEAGVVVMNTPTGNTISTAEHAFSLLLSLARNTPQAHASVIAGKWERKAYQGVELNGKRLAIVGMGRIGVEFAKRALAFGMDIVAYDPFLTPTRANTLKVELADSVNAALTGADVVTLHVPLTDETRHVLNAERLSLMNKGALVINCARGGLVDEEALNQALEDGHVGGAALDVFEVEPPPAKYALFDHEKVVFTPHLGASTAEAQENVGIQVAQQMLKFFDDGSISNAVNMPSLDAQTLREIGAHLELARNLGKILVALAPTQPDALRINFHGTMADLDTELLTRSALSGFMEHAREEGSVNLVNAPAFAKSIGLRVTESRVAEKSEYRALLEVEVVKGDSRYGIAGTFYGEQPRIVRIGGHFVEANPRGNLLVIENEDTPGIVGLIGTLVGTQSLNIANMALSRSAKGMRALTLIELDGEPSPRLLQDLGNNPAIHRAISIVL